MLGWKTSFRCVQCGIFMIWYWWLIRWDVSSNCHNNVAHVMNTHQWTESAGERKKGWEWLWDGFDLVMLACRFFNQIEVAFVSSTYYSHYTCNQMLNSSRLLILILQPTTVFFISLNPNIGTKKKQTDEVELWQHECSKVYSSKFDMKFESNRSNTVNLLDSEFTKTKWNEFRVNWIH